MKMIWHIMKKDLRAIWPIWVAWLGLMAVRIPLLDYYMHNASLETMFTLFFVSGCAFLADAVLIFSLVRKIIHEDPVMGDRGFWITRPIRSRDLLLAKCVMVCLVCVVLPLVLLIPAWVGFGFNVTEVRRVLVYHCTLNGCLVFAGLGFAVVTRSASRFWVTLVLTMVGALIFAFLPVTHLFVFFESSLFPQKIVLTSVVVGLVGFGIGQQFFKRKTWLARTALIAGVIVMPSLLNIFHSNADEVEPKGKFLKQPMAVTWKDGAIYLRKTDSKSDRPDFVRGDIAVTIPDADSSARFKLTRGEWIDPRGATIPADPLDFSGHLRDQLFSDQIKFNRVGDGSFTGVYPLFLTSDWLRNIWNKPQPWEHFGFSGQLQIEFSHINKVADIKLEKGAEARVGSRFTRLVEVKTYEKAVEISFVEVSAAGAENSALSVVDPGGCLRWAQKDRFRLEGAPLLWIQMKHRNVSFKKNGAAAEEEESNENSDRGRETNENLAEAGWRFVSKVTEVVGYGEYDLKADQLTIHKDVISSRSSSVSSEK